MYTQNTPVHVKLWHKDFWLMAVANLLLTVAVYIQIPLLPIWMIKDAGFSPGVVAVSLGIFGLGVFSLGFFCSYLVQKYRRNLVCIRSIWVLVICFCALYYIQRGYVFQIEGYILIPVLRFIQGAAFGLAQMVLSSTLIIDTCESFQRTEANHSSAWFSRLALSVGPLISILLMPMLSVSTITLISAVLCLLSTFLILSVKFPFRAPEDVICKVSLDRFFLPQGKWLFLNLSLVAVVVGLFLSAEHTSTFYAMLMAGFILAMLSQRFVFVNAELKSEVVTGILLMMAACLMYFSGDRNAINLISPTLLGCGIGIIGARFLLFFLKLSLHCQRGTSQSTFFLSWEFGISLGIFLGYYFFYNDISAMYIVALTILCMAMLMYLLFTHTWYIKNKNR